MDWPEQRGGGSSVFEPLVRGGSFNFQLPLRGGSSCFFFLIGIGTHLTQSTTKITPFKQLKQVTLKHQSTVWHAHSSHITLAVGAMDSCFCLIRNHQHGIADGQKWD